MFTPGGFRSCDVPSDNINDMRYLLSQNCSICKDKSDVMSTMSWSEHINEEEKITAPKIPNVINTQIYRV